MSHNPLEAEVVHAAGELENLLVRHAELTSDLESHTGFDRAGAEQRVTSLQGRCQKTEVRLADTLAELETARQEHSTLGAKARWGRNPRHWLSEDRNQAKNQLPGQARKVRDLDERQTVLRDRLDRARARLAKAEEAVARYDEFDPAAATVELAALDAEIPARRVERDALAERKERLDVQLEGPIESLTELQAELSRATSRRASLGSDVARFERDIKKADRLDKALSAASDGREKYEVHQECEDEFNEGSPRQVLRDRRRRLSEARREISSLEGRIPGLERNVGKAEQRVATIVARGTRDVRSIVIDGNNLCYAGEKFIGLAALRPLCLRLRESYDVTLVFDASISRLLSGSADERHWLSEDKLRGRFPGVTLHVVAARTQADETILAAAAEPFVYVLSNDRFAELRDKPAVRDRRLLTHEILNDQVLVHDLDVSLTFAPGA